MQARQPVYILDASYNIPGVTGDPIQEFHNRRIPNAKFFEIDTIADKTSSYPHMMPDNNTFNHYMKKLGIKNDENPLVIYDRLGVISSPRVWFTFKTFGRKNIAVLNGGLPKWVEESLPTESGQVAIYN
mmetsp:Transcript_17265/g.2859  ORF Transcript_17265/g.2859 Transcript_17265/m.2859 type:complete len:129 (+) Transcript_17265:72-458(+)